MTHSYLVAGCRTPMGKLLGGLASMPATRLAAITIAESLRRAGVKPEQVDEVILGQVLQAGAGQAPARQAALAAGIPASVGAVTINKVCGSGLKAVMLADQAIRAGDAKIIVAGGMESMSRAPHLLPSARAGTKFGHVQILDSVLHDGLWCAAENTGMGSLADFTAATAQVSREDQDAFALESHRRAVAAIDSGAFRDEIVPVPVAEAASFREPPTPKLAASATSSEPPPPKLAASATSSEPPTPKLAASATSQTMLHDEGPRRDASLAGLQKLRPAFDKSGSATAGNASQISDGAASVIVVDEAIARGVASPIKARIVASATAARAPKELFLAPIEAIRAVLAKARLTVGDIDLFEINEAFASQVLACQRQLEIPLEKLNVHGGAIALGHPIGASGTRVLVTLLHALSQRKLRRGLVSLCLGGGEAVALVVERE